MIFFKQTTYFMIVNTDSVPAIRQNMLLTGGLGLFVLCMLVFMAYPSTLANAGWKEVPKLEYQA